MGIEGISKADIFDEYFDDEPQIKVELFENTPELMTFGVSDKIAQIATNHIIEKNKLIEDYIYKNLEIHTLELMKLKIENELLERRLKESEG